MDKPRYLPDPDRLSVLAATIILAYTLTRFIEFPERNLSLQLPGIYIAINLNIYTIVTVLVAGLTAAGTTWLLGDHPGLIGKITLQHWILPALTAWIIGIPLNQINFSLTWWFVLAVGGVLLTLILVAEYIVIDPDDIRQPLAAAGLTAVAFALLLVLAITLRYAGVRLYLFLPALTIGSGLVCLRAMYLRLHGRWTVIQAGIASLITGQIAAALYYWPVSPITYGLCLLGPAYALSSLLSNLMEEKPLRQAILEPALALLIVWVTAWLTK